MRIIYIITCLMLILPTQQAIAQGFTTCAQGINTCQPFVSIPAKYVKCMGLICHDVIQTQIAKRDAIEQCEVGYRKCDALRNEPLYYWTCVDETCRNQLSNVDPSCKRGHKECVARLKQYWLCMSATCNTVFKSYKSCSSGLTECASDLTQYWSCVTQECLGNPYKYRDPNYYIAAEKSGKTIRYLRDLKVPPPPLNYTAPPLHGTSDRIKYAPQGINPHDWNAIIPAPTRQIIGSVSSGYACSTPQASISCQTNDLSSCTCSDGSNPHKRQSINEKSRHRNEIYRKRYHIDNPVVWE